MNPPPPSSSGPAPHRTLLPLFLDVVGKRVLVVGGGPVGTRKAEEIAAAGARVVVVTLTATDELRAQTGAITLVERAFEDADVDDAWLVVAATNDAATQERIARACATARVFCVAVDDPPNASAYGGGIVRRGPITIAISTSGEAPAVARLLRELIEGILPDDGYLDAARALRAKWKAEGTPMGSRFDALVRAFKSRADR